MNKMTKKQRMVYECIINTTAERGYPPSVREICAEVGLASPSTVHAHLKALKNAGFIQKEDNKTRAITVEYSESYTFVPLYGNVAAGAPILAEENIEYYVPFVQGAMTGEFYALHVRGDSMIEAGIMDGDEIIVRKQPTANNGQIVVALIEDEATVKRLKMGREGIWLMPENPDYSPIDGRNASILGIVVALSRKYV